MSDNDTPELTARDGVPSDNDGADGAPGASDGPHRTDPKLRRTARRVRFGILLTILGLVTVTGYLHQHPIAGLRTIGVDALCPFGGLESLWALLTGGSLLQHIAVSTFVVFGFTVVMALVFRRVFCGYVCPLGTLQELFGRLGRRIFGRRRPTLPAAFDRPARLLKYVVLVVVAVWTWQAGTLVVRGVDPWVAFMHLSTAEVLTDFGGGLAILAVAVLGSVVYERFFCRYLCPMGALLAPLSRFAPFAIRRNENTCTSCTACDRACPVGVKVSDVATVTDPECIACSECVNACPVADTLVVGAKVGARRTILTPSRFMGITVVVLLATLAATTAAGAFEWTIATTPAVTGNTVDPESIKGYMTFADIASTTGIAPEAFEQRFGVSPADMTTPIKDLASTYGFDVHTDVRAFVEEQMSAAAAPAASGGED